MSLLAALLITILGRFLPRGWTALTAAVMIIFYTLLVGALSTLTNGQIELVSDGIGLWVNAGKAPKK